MSMKKLGVALAVVMALGAVMASSAFATASTPSTSFWYKGGTKISTAQAVTCHAEGTLTLESTVLSKPFKLTATGVECLESTISNESSHAVDAGKLRFTGITVDEPAGCSVPSTLTTESLKTFLYEEGGTVYDKFEPATGSTGTFVKIPITGCAIESTPKVTGTEFGKSSNATGVEEATQPLSFSSSINSTAGGSLLLGSNAAILTGKAINESGGTAFGAKSS